MCEPAVGETNQHADGTSLPARILGLRFARNPCLVRSLLYTDCASVLSPMPFV
jgi:hypothetical protein